MVDTNTADIQSFLAYNAQQLQPLEEIKQEFMKDVEFKLGGSLIELEVDESDFSRGINLALQWYRTHSNFANMAGYTFIQTEADKNLYKLDDNVSSVTKIWSWGSGGSWVGAGGLASGGSPETDALRWLSYNGTTTSPGTLSSYYLIASHFDLAEKLLSLEILFNFDPYTKMLRVQNKSTNSMIGSNSVLLVETEGFRIDQDLLTDVQGARHYILEYATALMMQVIGRARSTFSNLAVPGSTAMNGSELVNEATTIMDDLTQKLKNFADVGGRGGSSDASGFGFIMG